MASGDVVGNRTEKEETKAIRDQEGEETCQSKFDGELDREKKAQPPDPRKGDGISPEKGVESLKARGKHGGIRHKNSILSMNASSFNPNGLE